jgi:hypothetical protein
VTFTCTSTRHRSVFLSLHPSVSRTVTKLSRFSVHGTAFAKWAHTRSKVSRRILTKIVSILGQITCRGCSFKRLSQCDLMARCRLLHKHGLVFRGVAHTVRDKRGESKASHLPCRVADVGKGEEHSIQGSGAPALGALWAEARYGIQGEWQILSITNQEEISLELPIWKGAPNDTLDPTCQKILLSS